jgi:hypothetical protein
MGLTTNRQSATGTRPQFHCDVAFNSRPPLIPVRYRGFLLIAILAGMSSAAGLVLVLAMRNEAGVHPSGENQPAPISKPSAFGTVQKPPASPDATLTPTQIAKAGNNSIVVVTGYNADDKPVAQATGYVYSASGIVVTSFSAIRGASSVTVDSSSGAELSVIALMGYSVSRDLAVLAVLEGNLTALETGAGETVIEGDPVVVLGPDNKVSTGVAGMRQAIGGVDMIQITAPASGGSPVLNAQGKVIGLATHRNFGGRMATLAVPSHYISDLLAERHVMSFGEMLEETQK